VNFAPELPAAAQVVDAGELASAIGNGNQNAASELRGRGDGTFGGPTPIPAGGVRRARFPAGNDRPSRSDASASAVPTTRMAAVPVIQRILFKSSRATATASCRRARPLPAKVAGREPARSPFVPEFRPER
jgi:hypothetical protein